MEEIMWPRHIQHSLSQREQLPLSHIHSASLPRLHVPGLHPSSCSPITLSPGNFALSLPFSLFLSHSALLFFLFSACLPFYSFIAILVSFFSSSSSCIFFTYSYMFPLIEMLSFTHIQVTRAEMCKVKVFAPTKSTDAFTLVSSSLLFLSLCFFLSVSSRPHLIFSHPGLTRKTCIRLLWRQHSALLVFQFTSLSRVLCWHFVPPVFLMFNQSNTLSWWLWMRAKWIEQGHSSLSTWDISPLLRWNDLPFSKLSKPTEVTLHSH